MAALIGEPASNALVDQIVARGQGNPFFTRELVAAHLAGETIPVVLSDLISAEIADLDDHARLVLGAIATIGRETSHELLAAIAALTDHELEAAVRTVIDARLLVVDITSGAYRFRHPLLGEVVYADLLPPQRSRLHRRVAETLRQQSADVLRRADRAGELAFHLDRAGDSDGAFSALLDAADAAETVAPGAAFAHLERAFELWDTVGELGDGLPKRPPVASRRDRRLHGRQPASSGAGAALRSMPACRRSVGRGVTSASVATCGPPDDSTRAAPSSSWQQTSLSGDEGAEAAAVFAGLGQAELMSGHYAAADRWCAKVFDLVPDAGGNPGPGGWPVVSLGIVRSNQGDPDEGVELCRESLAAATSAQSRTFASVYLCVALIDAGQYRSRHDTALDAVAEGQLTGLDRASACYFDSLAAEALTRLGRWSEAASVLARQPGRRHAAGRPASSARARRRCSPPDAATPTGH